MDFQVQTLHHYVLKRHLCDAENQSLPGTAALRTPLIFSAGSTLWLILRVESCLEAQTVMDDH